MLNLISLLSVLKWLCFFYLLTTIDFILTVLWYLLLYLSSNLSKWYDSHISIVLILLKPNFHSAVTEFSSLCWTNFYITVLPPWFVDILQHLLPYSTHILFGLQPDLPRIFWNALVNVKPVLSFVKLKDQRMNIYWKFQ